MSLNNLHGFFLPRFRGPFKELQYKLSEILNEIFKSVIWIIFIQIIEFKFNFTSIFRSEPRSPIETEIENIWSVRCSIHGLRQKPFSVYDKHSFSSRVHEDQDLSLLQRSVHESLPSLTSRPVRKSISHFDAFGFESAFAN